MPTPDGPQFIEFSDPDGSQFQSLWDSAMADAQANLDALSDEELEGGAFLADPGGGGEWIDDPEASVSDAIRGMIDASQIEETGHTQAEQPVTHGGILPTENQISAAADRDRAREAGHTPDMTDMQGRAFRPNYDEPDPFDRSDPEQARQAKAIEDMNELWDE